MEPLTAPTNVQKRIIRLKVILAILVLIVFSLILQILRLRKWLAGYQDLLDLISSSLLISGVIGLIYEFFIRYDMVKMVEQLLTSILTTEDYFYQINDSRSEKILLIALKRIFGQELSDELHRKLMELFIKPGTKLKRINFTQVSEIVKRKDDEQEITIKNEYILQNDGSEKVKIFPTDIIRLSFVFNFEEFMRLKGKEQKHYEYLWLDKSGIISKRVDQGIIEQMSPFTLNYFELEPVNIEDSYRPKNEKPEINHGIDSKEIFYEVHCPEELPPGCRVKVKYSISLTTVKRRYSVIIKRLTNGVKIMFNHPGIEKVFMQEFFSNTERVHKSESKSMKRVDVNGWVYPNEGIVFYW